MKKLMQTLQLWYELRKELAEFKINHKSHFNEVLFRLRGGLLDKIALNTPARKLQERVTFLEKVLTGKVPDYVVKSEIDRFLYDEQKSNEERNRIMSLFKQSSKDFAYKPS